MSKAIWGKLKKLFLTAISVIVLTAAFVMPSSAFTRQSEWLQMTGGASFAATEQGAVVKNSDALSLWQYTKNTIDLNNFSATFTLEQKDYWVDMTSGYYHAITLTNKKGMSGYGLFLLMEPMNESTLRLEGQILNHGLLLSPTYVIFDVDTTQPITIRGTMTDNEHYKLTIDGDSRNEYLFEIPTNYPFHTDLDGQAYFAIGNATNGSDEVMTTAISLCEYDFTGVDPDASEEPEEPVSSAPGTSEGGDISLEDLPPIDPDAVLNNNREDGSSSSTASDALVITLLVCLCVLMLVVIILILFYLLFVRKKIAALKQKQPDGGEKKDE